MFPKIPQRFTAPFGLLGDEAKMTFRSQPGGIAKLASVRNITETDSYWNQYIDLFDSASDVFSLITPHDVRRALLDAPENIATLIRVICSRLFNLVSNHTFPTQPNASVAAYATSLIKSGTGSTERNATKEVLNCLRILQRVLPVVFEVEGESSAFELEVLWKKEEVKSDLASESEPQFVIKDENESDGEEPTTPNPRATKESEQVKLAPSLGERLFSCITDLLFCCGFTLPTKIQVDHYKINYVIWEKGIGSTSDPGPNQPYDNNKIEVLRLLLVLLSRQIYITPSSLLSKPSLYSIHMVQKTARRDVLTILCSLLNTAMNSAAPANISLAGMAGKLPYNHLVFKGEDSRANLVSICLQVLCVLLDFQSGSARDKVTGTGDNQTSSPVGSSNAFRYFLAKLHRMQDFCFIADGIASIFVEQLAAMNNLLPGARKNLPYISETTILFWKMIELNKKFRLYLLETDKGIKIISYLLCYCLEIKDKPEQHGLCRAISYILQTISSEPSFGLKLSGPIEAQLPAKWHVTGTAGDFLINAVYSIIATTSGAMNSIYPALIIALSNCAPFFKNLTVNASTRLIQLFTSFSNPLFLLSDEGHPRLLFFMLEIFNAVILHNLSENPNLIYGLLTAHKAFEDLGTFTLARGLREIRRVQLAKEEQNQKRDIKGKSVADSHGAEEHPHDEKARLLESESGTLNRTASERASSDGGNESQSRRTSSGQEGQDSSTTTPPLPETSGASAVSEKVRGKMRAERSGSTDLTGSLEQIALSGFGKNGFVPTQEWVTSWQQGLPLDSLMLVISELLPKIQELQLSRRGPSSTTRALNFLESVSLKHVLPLVPPVAQRRFIWSDASIIWLTSLIWGEIYVRGMAPLGIWNSTNVRLFYVKHAQTQPRQLTEAVSHVVGGILGRSPSDNSVSGGRRT